MKTLFLALCAAFCLASCSTPVVELQTKCNVSPEELLNNAARLVALEGMIVRQSDPKMGYMLAESSSQSAFVVPTAFFIATGSQTEAKFWMFHIQNGKLMAKAKFMRGSHEFYCNDELSWDEKWYWNVRNGLELICQNKVEFVEAK